MTALGPGRLVTATLGTGSVTRRYPGSEMSGVPASDTSATGSAAHEFEQAIARRSVGMVVIAPHRLANAQMRAAARDAGILAGGD
jgi:hypothetical protein